jgi:hypothetical protein
MADPMETPIDALIDNDDDEVTKTIMAELEKHQQEKQKIQEQLHIQQPSATTTTANTTRPQHSNKNILKNTHQLNKYLII